MARISLISSILSRKSIRTFDRSEEAITTKQQLIVLECAMIRRLNVIPHFLSRNRFADECIAEADFTEALHVLLSETGLDVVAERAEELPQ
jgi:hypothetical protein